jgi:hypothetical protein
MGETTVLYALTTLAQSCAALAAFVGALGVFRIQMLRDQKRDAERNFHLHATRLIGQTSAMSRDAILERINQVRDANPTRPNPALVLADEARERWDAFSPRLLQARRALIRLELWTLAVIGASMIGFNFIPWLKDARWMPYALLLAVIVTVVVTLWSDVVWTGTVDG